MHINASIIYNLQNRHQKHKITSLVYSLRSFFRSSCVWNHVRGACSSSLFSVNFFWALLIWTQMDRMVITVIMTFMKQIQFWSRTCASECVNSFSSFSNINTAYTSFSSFSMRSRNFRITSAQFTHNVITPDTSLPLDDRSSVIFSVCTLRKHSSFDGGFGRLHDFFKHLSFRLAYQRHWAAHLPRTSRSADPMHVMLHRVGHGEVYDLPPQKQMCDRKKYAEWN